MFSELQVRKIKYFATVTKITNECFKTCVDIKLIEPSNISKMDNTDKTNSFVVDSKLNKQEENCLKSCSESYLKLRDFIEGQIFEDYESMKNKNKKVLEDET